MRRRDTKVPATPQKTKVFVNPSAPMAIFVSIGVTMCVSQWVVTPILTNACIARTYGKKIGVTQKMQIRHSNALVATFSVERGGPPSAPSERRPIGGRSEGHGSAGIASTACGPGVIQTLNKRELARVLPPGSAEYGSVA